MTGHRDRTPKWYHRTVTFGIVWGDHLQPYYSQDKAL